MVEVLERHLTQPTPSPFIFQPQCGSGLGLVVTQSFWRAHHSAPIQLFGCDSSPMAIELAKFHLWWQGLITSQTLPDLGDHLWVGTLETHSTLPAQNVLILP
ncbi:MAG: SAM-dependent DNA methyltransferase [Oscillatoriales cyanobacterium SM2_2_1]|nr:SAM-dependent DNA methyltransferase [Oscillatoriales cyanobacterium SM2_2_1]